MRSTKGIARNKYSLCLDYHIGKCAGACRGLINPEDYRVYISRVRQILNGETVELERYLRNEMDTLAEKWKFEEAQDAKEKYEIVKRYNAKKCHRGDRRARYRYVRIRGE